MARKLLKGLGCKTARHALNISRRRLKCDGTCAETRFRLSAKQKIPFKSTGASVQSSTGSRGVRISGSNASYTMFRGSVKGTGYPIHSPVSPSLPSPPVLHRVPLHFNWTLQIVTVEFAADLDSGLRFGKATVREFNVFQHTLGWSEEKTGIKCLDKTSNC